MMEKPPHSLPPAPESEPGGGTAPREHELEAETTEADEASPEPYEDLWDPDMDTRPERIKRTKARPKLDPRGRGRSASRGKRREEV
jgi:hypothetical protein